MTPAKKPSIARAARFTKHHEADIRMALQYAIKEAEKHNEYAAGRFNVALNAYERLLAEVHRAHATT